MDYFTYKNNELYCEGVSLEKLVKQFGTPLYVYSYAALKNRFERFNNAFKSIDSLICYSMKANSNGAVLKTFVGLGGGIDVVTGGELWRALKAGCPASRIVFAGVGKADDEISAALDAGILQFNVESEDELENISRIAVARGKKAPIALRVNPDVDPKTHAYISTGLKKSKFGVNHKRAIEIYKKASTMLGIQVVGIDCHIGSQITTTSPFVDAAKRVRHLVETLKSEGIEIKNWDIGGGLGIVYKDETPPTPEDYAKALLSVVGDLKLKFIFEPGRFLVGNTGALVTKALYNKVGENKNFLIVDAALNDLMRPAMYDAYHALWPVKKDGARPDLVADVVGPICETGDFFAHDRTMKQVLQGEYLALMSAGAYGFSMSSTYNSRPRACEVFVNGDQVDLVRHRETFEDLVRGEVMPGDLR